MRVLFISDFSLVHCLGGAQQSNALIVKEGKKRNHIITELFHDSKFELTENNYDIVVSSNLEIFTAINKYQILNFLNTCNNHVRLEHDSNSYLIQNDRKKLWSNCKASFFLTDFHKECFFKAYGADCFKNIKIVPDPISSKIYYNRFQQRDDKTLYAGFLHPLKGIDGFFNEAKSNPDKNYVIAGWESGNCYIPCTLQMPNVEYLGRIDSADMPSVYNAYKTLYCKPYKYEPFCRAAGEALMCGMTVDSNNLVGSVHYHNAIGHDKFVKQCNNASKMFWEILENEI